YMKMDPVLGEVRRRVGDDTTLMVMSDHGFAPWRRKFSLNRWLYDEGYLVLKEGKVPEGDGTGKVIVHHLPGRPEDSAVDWTKTRAYGAGFNGLYLNMKGREGIGPDGELGDPSLAGIVEPGAEADALLRELKEKLEAIVDEENGGARVVYSADITAEVYKNSERLAEAPDMQVGYDAGYGNSDASSTGRSPSYVLADNNGGTFNGNHLMASQVVAGSLLSNRKVLEGDHALEDLTVEILRRYGITPDESMKGSRVLE
ncbi:MAG: alkaline phosphatase family protein, partial [Planctomycetota bacterium]